MIVVMNTNSAAPTAVQIIQAGNDHWAGKTSALLAFGDVGKTTVPVFSEIAGIAAEGRDDAIGVVVTPRAWAISAALRKRASG